MEKLFATAEIKAAGDAGEFEAIASAPVLDRDGEVIDAGAFDPLPADVPIHAYHAFSDPIGRGVPYYDGDQLMIRGTFAGTPRAQEMRQLVADGAVPAVSVGFMIQDTDEIDGVRHITSAELLEVSLVSVPALREARILAVKSADLELKAGARNNSKDAERLQQIHDLSVANGATCKAEPSDDEKSADDTVVELKTSTDDEETDPGNDAAAAAEKAAAPADAPASGTEQSGEGDDLMLRLRALQLQADAVA